MLCECEVKEESFTALTSCRCFFKLQLRAFNPKSFLPSYFRGKKLLLVACEIASCLSQLLDMQNDFIIIIMKRNTVFLAIYLDIFLAQ